MPPLKPIPQPHSESISRRQFLYWMGATSALTGISACTKMPAEKIIPYIQSPESFIPGKPRFYATACSFGGFAKGVIAKSEEGRPTKLEGNPKHPLALGKSDLFSQAELLQLYDPDRSQAVLHLGEISTWDGFIQFILQSSVQWKTQKGAGIRFLSHTLTSPTLLLDIASFQRLYPQSKWHTYDPIHTHFTREATHHLYGKELKPIYDFRKAKVILSLDHDFLGPNPAREKYTRDFMSLRKLGRGTSPEEFNRLYMIEPSISLTGAAADHRWPIPPSQIPQVLEELAILLKLIQVKNHPRSRLTTYPWLKTVASDLMQNQGRSLILVGEQQAPEVQALGFAINESLGNVGKSLHWIPRDSLPPSLQPQTLENLLEDIRHGQVQTLFILGANPIYDTASTSKFQEHYLKVPQRIHMGLYSDETSYYSHWHLPESHFLETWGDLRAFDGTASIQQPLISPLYETRSLIELFSILTEKPGRGGFQAIQNYWKNHTDLNPLLREGWIPETTTPPVLVKPRPEWTPQLITKFDPSEFKNLTNSTNSKNAPSIILEAIFKPDPTIWDGRYSNNAWLQELPKPILQLTWGNAVILSPQTAEKHSLQDEDLVEIRIDDRHEKAPILRIPGHPEESITLYFGYGRSRSGRFGNHQGYNAYLLQDHLSPFTAPQVQIIKLGVKQELATAHTHFRMEPHKEGRNLVVHSDLTQFIQNPGTLVNEDLKKSPPSLLPDYRSSLKPEPREPYLKSGQPSSTPSNTNEAWAMVIDLSSCIGCKSCTIACQAENNIPVVGKAEVRNSREMHWIRVDRYFESNGSQLSIFFQPVPCMHCEKAPCEEVCPTGATNHSSDGLNQMVYNRCVGTRYCSNNCPYKVRRFNFFQYSDTQTKSIQLMHNPEVTVRSRGVMEKCTYCVQRIQSIRIEAELGKREIQDGEILTACQQVCPTDAIVFGNQNQSKSQVSILKHLPHHYRLLNELGTLPRTTYLASIKNRNSSLPEGTSE